MCVLKSVQLILSNPWSHSAQRQWCECLNHI